MMYQLKSVFFLAMDVVKGPYIHCYAPNQTQEVGSKRVCTNTQSGHEVELVKKQENYDNLSKVINKKSNVHTKSEDNATKAGCDYPSENDKNKCERGIGVPVSYNYDRSKSIIYHRVSALCNLFVPRAELCNELEIYYDAELQLVFLYYAEEISGNQYARQTLRYSLCLVFELLTSHTPTITLCEEMQHSLKGNYGVLLENVMSELRTAEQKFNYISNALNTKESSKENRDSKTNNNINNNNKNGKELMAKELPSHTEVTKNINESQHAAIANAEHPNTNHDFSFTSFIERNKQNYFSPSSSSAAAAAVNKEFSKEIVLSKKEQLLESGHKKHSLNYFVSPRSKEVHWCSLQELVTELYSCLLAQNNVHWTCKDFDMNKRRVITKNSNNTDELHVEQAVRSVCDKTHDEFSLIHLSNVHSFHIQHTTTLQPCIPIMNNDVPMPLVSNLKNMNKTQYNDNIINVEGENSHENKNEICMSDYPHEQHLTQRVQYCCYDEDEFDLLARVVWQLADGRRTVTDIIFALVFETNYTLAELTDGVKREMHELLISNSEFSQTAQKGRQQHPEAESIQVLEEKEEKLKDLQEKQQEELCKHECNAHAESALKLFTQTGTTENESNLTNQNSHVSMENKKGQSDEVITTTTTAAAAAATNEKRNEVDEQNKWNELHSAVNATSNYKSNLPHILWLKQEESNYIANANMNEDCKTCSGCRVAKEECISSERAPMQKEQIRMTLSSLKMQLENKRLLSGKVEQTNTIRQSEYFDEYNTVRASIHSKLEWELFTSTENAANNKSEILTGLAETKKINNPKERMKILLYDANKTPKMAITYVHMNVLLLNTMMTMMNSKEYNVNKYYNNNEEQCYQKSVVLHNDVIVALPRVKWFKFIYNANTKTNNYEHNACDQHSRKQQFHMKQSHCAQNMMFDRSNRIVESKHSWNIAIDLPANWHTFSYLVYEALQHLQSHELLKIIPDFTVNTLFQYTAKFITFERKLAQSARQKLALFFIQLMKKSQNHYVAYMHTNKEVVSHINNINSRDDKDSNVEDATNNINNVKENSGSNWKYYAESQQTAAVPSPFALLRCLMQQRLSENALFTEESKETLPSSSCALTALKHGPEQNLNIVVTALFAAYKSFRKRSIHDVHFCMQKHPFLSSAFCN